MSAFIDLSGQQFGRLTVMERSPISPPVHWRCRCVCGQIVTVKAILLRLCHTQSCGCLRRELAGALKYTHGMAVGGSHRAPEYRVWLTMNQRCRNPNTPEFKNYGARGIVVCDRWRQSFKAFYDDMGPRPQTSKGRQREYSIERINNNGPYAPENCRWATAHDQSRNKRNNRLITFSGVTQTLQDWEEQTGLHIRNRLNAGWSVERAITTRPIRGRPHR